MLNVSNAVGGKAATNASNTIESLHKTSISNIAILVTHLFLFLVQVSLVSPQTDIVVMSFKAVAEWFRHTRS